MRGTPPPSADDWGWRAPVRRGQNAPEPTVLVLNEANEAVKVEGEDVELGIDALELHRAQPSEEGKEVGVLPRVKTLAERERERDKAGYRRGLKAIEEVDVEMFKVDEAEEEFKRKPHSLQRGAGRAAPSPDAPAWEREGAWRDRSPTGGGRGSSEALLVDTRTARTNRSTTSSTLGTKTLTTGDAELVDPCPTQMRLVLDRIAFVSAPLLRKTFRSSPL